MNVEHEGLVGHCWKALTITTEYSKAQTVNGIHTDSNQPFTIEHSADGEVWTRVEGEFMGVDVSVEQPLQPFVCRYTRMSWATTAGSSGIHAQFVGSECNTDRPADVSECREDEESVLPCVKQAVSDVCEQLQDKINTRVASVEKDLCAAEEEYKSKYDQHRDDWEEQLEEGISTFEARYESEIKSIQEALRTKHNAHKARLAEIEKEFLTERQTSLDETKQRLQDKLNEFEKDIAGQRE